jgi:hypothetical protein
MFSFFFFPFGFIIPIFMMVIAVRIGTRIFRGFMQKENRTGIEYYRRQGLNGIYPTEFTARRGRAVEAQIFKLAYKRRGRVTVSDIVVETGLGVEEAEELVQGMVDQTRVRMEVSEQGTVYYEFPEIIERFRQDGES